MNGVGQNGMTRVEFVYASVLADKLAKNAFGRDIVEVSFSVLRYEVLIFNDRCCSQCQSVGPLCKPSARQQGGWKKRCSEIEGCADFLRKSSQGLIVVAAEWAGKTGLGGIKRSRPAKPVRG